MIHREQMMNFAQSARLRFNGDEIDAAMTKMERMYEYVQVMLSSDGMVEAPHHLTIPSDLLRNDEVRQGLSQMQVLAMAPKHDSGYIVVPRIFEER